MGGVVETPQNGGTFLFSKGNSELLSEECLLSEDKYKTTIEPIFSCICRHSLSLQMENLLG